MVVEVKGQSVSMLRGHPTPRTAISCRSQPPFVTYSMPPSLSVMRVLQSPVGHEHNVPDGSEYARTVIVGSRITIHQDCSNGPARVVDWSRPRTTAWGKLRGEPGEKLRTLHADEYRCSYS